MYNSVVLSGFTVLCNHHHNLILEGAETCIPMLGPSPGSGAQGLRHGGWLLNKGCGLTCRQSGVLPSSAHNSVEPVLIPVRGRIRASEDPEGEYQLSQRGKVTSRKSESRRETHWLWEYSQRSTRTQLHYGLQTVITHAGPKPMTKGKDTFQSAVWNT